MDKALTRDEEEGDAHRVSKGHLGWFLGIASAIICSRVSLFLPAEINR